MKTVFILGAGASAEAGAPLMNNFFDRAQDLMYSGRIDSGDTRNRLQEVFAAIYEMQGVHAKSFLDLDNIEIVFGAIEMGLLLRRFGGRTLDGIEQLRESLITLIYKTLELSVEFPVVDGRVNPPPPYLSFADMLKRIERDEGGNYLHDYSFVTFNYDLCLEQALHRRQRNYSYCLDGNGPVDGASPLLKLHGSINWGTIDDGDNAEFVVPYDVSKIQFTDLSQTEHVFYCLGTNLHCMKVGDQPLQGPPVIVPHYLEQRNIPSPTNERLVGSRKRTQTG